MSPFRVIVCLLVSVFPGIFAMPGSDQRKILVFGGNGFLGSAAVERFIGSGDNVTMVNRGNLYWDSLERIHPYVSHISCDRKNDVDSCEDLVQLINSVDQFDAVVDFSAYSDKEAKDAAALLKGKAKLYILISTDSIYDVCSKDHDGLTKEIDDSRPENEDERSQVNYYRAYGHGKKLAEEELIKQRQEDQGIPYVILRLPDVFGPRDSTYRWWIYQTWIKVESHKKINPLSMPTFLVDYDMSLVYSEDVSKLIHDLILRGDVLDQVFNVAYPERYTLKDLILIMQKTLETGPLDVREETNQTQTVYLYPSVRKGPIDVSKIHDVLGWTPTPFEEAVKETIKFHEEAMKGGKFSVQRDEIVQAISHQIYRNHIDDLYSSLEDIYDIDLKHFKPHEEL